MSSTHGRACAARLRQRGDLEGWSTARIAREIAACCAISALRAHRLARGWTQEQAVSEFRAMCATLPGETPHIDQDQLGAWERSARRPRARTLDLLCRLYRTDAQGLGLAGDYSDRPSAAGDSAASHVAPASAATSSVFAQVVLLPGSGVFEQQADAARRAVDRVLAAASVTPAQLDLLDERIAWHRRYYTGLPPLTALERMLADIDEIRVLAGERQPALIQMRLSELAAILATLIADALMKLGNVRQAEAWFGTARTAADDSGNAELRARVRVQAAMLPYYYGPLESAVHLSREARLLGHGRASATTALAAAAEARAVARLGDPAAAEDAIRHAMSAFERADPGDDHDAFAFPERRLLLYLSGAYTFLGRHSKARDARRQALPLYAARPGIDPALLNLEEAVCLAREHSVEEACQLAGATFLHVPEPHRTPILGARARHVIKALPAAAHSARAVKQLHEVLALPAAPM